MIGLGVGIGLGFTNKPGGSGSQLFSGQALGGFSVSNKIDSAANQLADFRPGKTLWLIFQSTAINNTGVEDVLGCNIGNLSKGWWLTRQQTTNYFYLLAGGSNFTQLLATPTHGVTALCIVWQASDNHVKVAINGGLFTDYGAVACTPADSTCKTYIGTPNGVFGSIPLTSGRVIAFATWSTEASQADANAGTFTQGDRFVFPASVTSAAVVDFRTMRDFSAAGFTTLGSSPVTLTVSGSPALTRLAERRIVTTDSLYWDSKLSIPQTDGDGYAYTIRNVAARLKLTTDALSVAVEAYSTLAAVDPTLGGIGLYSNGSYVSEALLLQSSKPQLFEMQPGAGSGKTVELWEGPQRLTGSPGVDPRLGVFMRAIRLPVYLEDGSTPTNSSTVTPTPPQNRLVTIVDSIGVGFYNTPFASHSPIALLRADYPGGVTCFGTGSESVYRLAHDQATADATAALAASMCDGTDSNRIWLGIQTNDYGEQGELAATFATYYARLLDALHAACPVGTLIDAQSAVQRISPAAETANGAGSTLGDFRSTGQTVATARSAYCTYVEGAAGAIISDANMYADGIHTVSAGGAQLKAVMKTTIGY